jgi:formamidopyrimidine-DNA glycosylase
VELPEVEVVRRDLEKDVVGRRVAEVDVRRMKNTKRVIRRHKTPKEFRDRLKGRKIARADRKGKYVLLHLDDGNVLVVHFGMTGRFLRGNKRLPLDNHTHVIITFQQGGDLRFVDPRTFGELFVRPVDELGRVKELAHLAIDPLESTFTWQQFSGVLGNIYSDEVLFAAGLRHDRNSAELSAQEVRRLYRSIQEVVQEAIRFRGTTLGDEAYVDVFGKPGEYQHELKVYGRRGEPCRRCRTPIQVVKYSGRNSYFCPQCQS